MMDSNLLLIDTSTLSYYVSDACLIERTDDVEMCQYGDHFTNIVKSF